MGSFTVELYYKHAPKTVDNFVKLSDKGYYDGTIFHRIIRDFSEYGLGVDGMGWDWLGGRGAASGGCSLHPERTLPHAVALPLTTNPPSPSSRLPPRQ
jgi:peptidyl-prolyl cis-trans isomerase-like 1